MSAELPIAEPIELHEDSRGYWSVRVRCPYCSKTHHHGVFAGAVVAHCPGPARVTRHYRQPPHRSRSYFIPPAALEALVATHNTQRSEEQS